MKKFYFMAFIATAVLTMTSCSNDDITTGTDFSKNETEAQAINFSTYLGRAPQSRATTSTDNLKSFGVFAAYTESADWSSSSALNFMLQQEVTKNEGQSSWSYTPLKYWPANETDKISFFAYAPTKNDVMSELTTKTTDGKAPSGAPSATFTIDKDKLGTTPDFVVASVMNQAKADKVSFNFKHAMTRVAMTAQTDKDIDNSSKVIITGVTVNGDELATKATYTFPYTGKENGEWTNDAKESTTSIELDAALNKTASGITGDNTNGVNLSSTPASIYSTSVVTDNYLYLIPANSGTGLSADGKVKVSISYAIITTDNKLANGSITTTATKEVNLPKGALAQGKSYKFNIKIGINAIVLDVTEVAAWGDDTTIPEE